MRTRLGAVAVATMLVAGCNSGAGKREQVDAALRKTLGASARPTFVTADREGRRLWKLTQQFYERRDYAPAWIDGTNPAPQMKELIAALHAAGNEGLDPELYNVSLLDQRRQEARKGFLTKKGFNPTEAGALDAWLTWLYMKYASDLADGLSDLAHADPNWQIKTEKFDPAARLEQALERQAVEQSLRELTPENSQYRSLRQVLADYKRQAAEAGWPALPANLRLKAGQRNAFAGALARRLAASGDYQGATPSSGASAVYDAALQEAVQRFQRRHGLTDDGVVSAGLIAEMNVPLERRIRQIELNLERWRWLPRKLGDRHILVNIPEYRLEVWEGDRVPLAMKVVVGKHDTPTPIFNDEMTYIVFSPYWNVPPNIAQGETLPEMLKDPAFLERSDMEVVDASGQLIDPGSIDLADPTQYRFRQRPGAQNSLGLVKFMFPNQFNVYLHDTPADSLFARASRSFSHGCVRLEQPRALAEYLLRDQADWTPERIDEAMHAGEERAVKLKSSVPVYLGYWTARVSPDGVLQFRQDVYGIDAQQTALLAERLKRLKKAAAAAAMTAQALKPTSPSAGANSSD